MAGSRAMNCSKEVVASFGAEPFTPVVSALRDFRFGIGVEASPLPEIYDYPRYADAACCR